MRSFLPLAVSNIQRNKSCSASAFRNGKLKAAITIITHLLIFFSNASLYAQILNAGETQYYSVTWYSISLGTIELMVTEKMRDGDTNSYKTRSIFKTDPQIPIISVSDTLYSVIDELFYTRHFLTHEWSMDGGHAASYTIDYERKVYEFSKWNLISKSDTTKKSIKFDIPIFQDGISSIYYTRYLSGKDTTVEFPTLISGKIKWTEIISSSSMEINKFHEVEKYKEVYKIKGKAKYDGFRGFTGKFKAYFTTDNKRILLYAELDFLLGKVKIRLEDETINY